jgi:hypothetical protein
MSWEGNGQEVYKLDFIGPARQSVMELREQSKQQGKPEITDAMNRVFKRLLINPSSVGELYQTLKSLNLHLHVVVDRPLVIHFGYNVEKKIVIVQRVYLQNPP